MYTDGRDEHMRPEDCQRSSPISIPASAQTWHNRRTSTAGTSSSTAEDDSDTQSNISSPSTAPSSAPSLPMNYELHCEFGFTGCQVSFHPTQIDSYISHAASHFLHHLPPLKTICIFCNQIFEDLDDPVANWTRRMRHIADDYRQGWRFEQSRPDFLLLKHLRNKGLISSEDYKWSKRHSERPDCDGLVDRSYKTPERKRKEERLMAEPHDLEKEARHRRRHASNTKGKGKGK